MIYPTQALDSSLNKNLSKKKLNASFRTATTFARFAIRSVSLSNE
jgi:hypothetical protein